MRGVQMWIGVVTRVGVLTTLVAVGAMMAGCTKVKPQVLAPLPMKERPHDLAIFFDGTANDETHSTNVKKLHSLLSLQGRTDVGTLYVDGVGSKMKVIGMATGWGIGHRVRLAYQYLLENHRRGDRIFLFGFSRGAYSARILAALLNYAGLPDQPLPSDCEESRKHNEALVDRIYDAYKGEMSPGERRDRVKEVLQSEKLAAKRVTVTFMGLWDTVEALGTPNYEENVENPNKRYGDQLCNVRRAAHAVALDDTRARIFTPILLTRAHLFDGCDQDADGNSWDNTPENVRLRLNSSVEEVWFAGAHFDIGAGYDYSLIGGVSLNWMIREFNRSAGPTSPLPPGARVREDPDEIIHDPERGFFWGTLYRWRLRDLSRYVEGSPYNEGHLRVHYTAIDRMRTPERYDPDAGERTWQWRLNKEFPGCFQRNKRGGYDYRPEGGCLIRKVGPPGR